MIPRWIHHWSPKRLEFHQLRACRLDHGAKPSVGRPLWVSDENDFGWREWCQENEFLPIHYKHAYEVTFAPGSGVLRIQNPRQLLEFTRNFASRGLKYDDYLRTGMFLDWPAIATAYYAVLITPHQHTLRLDRRCSWYSGWDCASGVVLDPACIGGWVDVTDELIAKAAD